MNKFTEAERIAAESIAEHAVSVAISYSKLEDTKAAATAVLVLALELVGGGKFLNKTYQDQEELRNE